MITNTRAQLDFLPKQLKAFQSDRLPTISASFYEVYPAGADKDGHKRWESSDGLTGAVWFFLLETRLHRLHQASNF